MEAKLIRQSECLIFRGVTALTKLALPFLSRDEFSGIGYTTCHEKIGASNIRVMCRAQAGKPRRVDSRGPGTLFLKGGPS